MPSDPKRGRLPFEPRNNNKKKSEKTPAAKSPAIAKKKPKSTSRNSRQNSNLSAIPDEVSKRMGRRMAVFCGIPSALGMSSFFVFYWLRIKEVVDLPPYAAFAFSLGCLGLGVVGLSYGLFSTSWDEDRPGGIWGIAELKLNLGRTRDAWKASKEAKAD